jgi:hypothetical protein
MALTRRGKEVVAATAAAAALGLGATALHGETVKNDLEAQEQAALGVDKVELKHVVLKAGAKYRSTPVRIEDSTSGDSNEAGKVPKGQELVVSLPVADSEHPEWIAFRNPEDSTKLVWANLGRLADQGYATEQFSDRSLRSTDMNPAGSHVLHESQDATVAIGAVVGPEVGVLFQGCTLVFENGKPAEIAEAHFESAEQAS